jgi:hypothetical protein
MRSPGLEKQSVRDVARGVHRPDPPAAQRAPPAPGLILQRALGNRAFGRFVQAKLRVGPPGDRFEREADRVADAVVSGSAPAPAIPAAAPSIQRMCAECEEEQQAAGG